LDDRDVDSVREAGVLVSDDAGFVLHVALNVLLTGTSRLRSRRSVLPPKTTFTQELVSNPERELKVFWQVVCTPWLLGVGNDLGDIRARRWSAVDRWHELQKRARNSGDKLS